MIELQFSGSSVPAGLDKYGSVFDARPPRVKLKVPRGEVARILAALLDSFSIEDVSVSDRPLEEVIAEMFTSVDEQKKTAAVTVG